MISAADKEIISLRQHIEALEERIRPAARLWPDAEPDEDIFAPR
jgi:hypothetical protein